MTRIPGWVLLVMVWLCCMQGYAVERQPDLWIRSANTDYIGDGRFSEGGVGQTCALSATPNQVANYLFRVQNDGNTTERFRIFASPSSAQWQITYRDTDTNADITAQVTAGTGWTLSPLAAGATKGFWAQVRPTASAPVSSTRTLRVVAMPYNATTPRDEVWAVTTVSARYQADLWVRNQADANYRGDNLYLSSGSEQTVTQAKPPNTLGVYLFRVQNDGNTADTFTVTGTAGSNLWRTWYRDLAGTDITAQVTGSGWRTPVLQPGGAALVVLQVSAVTSLYGFEKTYVVTAASVGDPMRKDVGKAIHAARNEQINPRDGAVVIWVPTVWFTMGSAMNDPYAWDDERPQHQIRIDGFWIYKYEVTVAQYRAFCTATGRAMPPAPSWGWRDTHPVVNVSWYDAQAYSAWAGGALPTEAQWEVTARSEQCFRWPWGNTYDPEKYNNWYDNNPAGGGYEATQTAPVGSYPASISPYGAHDMAGNVWEWCSDWYASDYYSRSPQLNPTGPSTGTQKTVRSGSWHSLDFYGRCADRDFLVPDLYTTKVGFRCVLPAGTTME